MKLRYDHHEEKRTKRVKEIKAFLRHQRRSSIGPRSTFHTQSNETNHHSFIPMQLRLASAGITPFDMKRYTRYKGGSLSPNRKYERRNLMKEEELRNISTGFPQIPLREPIDKQECRDGLQIRAETADG